MATETAAPNGDAEQPLHVPPEIDVPALRAFLDGEHAEVRDLVRANLAEYASILTDAETLSHHDFRERVKDVVVDMAATGQTGMGFPKEYGGGGDIGASLAAFETLAYGDLSVLVKVGVQFGLFGGAILQLGTKAHHDVPHPVAEVRAAHRLLVLEDRGVRRQVGAHQVTDLGVPAVEQPGQLRDIDLGLHVLLAGGLRLLASCVGRHAATLLNRGHRPQPSVVPPVVEICALCERA